MGKRVRSDIAKPGNNIMVPKKRSFLDTFKKYKMYYFLLIPGLLYLIIFHYIPMFGIIISFKDYQPFMGVKGIFTSQWVGFKHFQKFFNSYYFWDILGNTLTISLLKFIFGFPAPIVFALLLNEVRNKKFMKTVQTISYLPHFLSWVVVSGLLVTLLSMDNGLINIIREAMGRESIMFLGDPRYFRQVLVVSDIWKGIGWGSIVYLAAISGVDQEMYEAAYIDGANRWRRIWHITLPSISNIVVIMLIFNVGGLLNAGFEQIFLLYSPSVYSVADIIDTFVYREGLQSNNYSYATAVGLFKSLVSMFLLLLTNFIAKRLDQEGIW
ncbi:MAG: ABC transporter permease subunit [Caldicoprobacterales bacterium]